MAGRTTSTAAMRIEIMQAAAEELSRLPSTSRTLAAFEEATGRIGKARGHPEAAFRRQHLRNHPELAAIYRNSRFGGETRPGRGLRSKSDEQLILDTDAANRRAAIAEKRAAEAEVAAELARKTNIAEIILHAAKAWNIAIGPAVK